MFFSKKTSPWVPLTSEIVNLFDAYLINHELFLNNLGTRIRQSGGWFGNLPKWNFFGLVSEAQQKLEGIFACNKQGFASIHLAHEGSKREFYARELGKTKMFQSTPIRMLMGESSSIKAIIPQVNKPLEITMDYAMLVRAKEKPIPSLTSIDGFRSQQSSLKDYTDLLPLQIAYEKEEVVLPGHSIQIQQTKQYLKESLNNQLCVHGRYQNTLITKGMTNVRGRTLDQIGGVYTLPEYRNRGLGKRTMIELIRLIHQQEKDASLFVKNYNIPAISLYTRIGFTRAGNFSIAYFF